MLVACGRGGSGSSGSSGGSAVSTASAELAKYEGVWRQECDNKHMRLTMTSTATGSTTFSVMKKEEHFDNADCTGALVATGSFGQPDENVQYSATLADASVQLAPNEIVLANVDPATSVLAVATFTVTGSGVKSTTLVGTTMFARIEYADGGYVVILRQAINGETTHGALLLRNGELLALVPRIGGSATEFQVNHRYIR